MHKFTAFHNKIQIAHLVSPLENFFSDVFPSSIPSLCATLTANGRLELPQNILMLGIVERQFGSILALVQRSWCRVHKENREMRPVQQFVLLHSKLNIATVITVKSYKHTPLKKQFLLRSE